MQTIKQLRDSAVAVSDQRHSHDSMHAQKVVSLQSTVQQLEERIQQLQQQLRDRDQQHDPASDRQQIKLQSTVNSFNR